jgi:hypothetical protein
MTTITGKFSFHVDANFFAFKWADAQYIDVDYSAANFDGKTAVCVMNITAAPHLLGMIIIHNNWMPLMKAIEDAARHSAEEYFSEQKPHETGIDPVMEQAIKSFAPHL